MKFFGLLTFIVLLSGACSTTSKTSTEPSNVIPGKVLVLLKERVKPAELENAFSAYEMKGEAQISRSQNYWMFTFNDKSIAGKQLLAELSKSELVVEAELAPLKESARQK